MLKGKISDIFFDLDHTLWDFEKNSALTFERLLIEYGVDPHSIGYIFKSLHSY
jgi:putative hydrolase of the HAD superfamily